jgi:ubiquitin-protein ligase
MDTIDNRVLRIMIMVKKINKKRHMTTRERQIQSLIQSNPTAYSENPSLFIVPHPTFDLSIQLPPSFPHVAPIIKVSPVLKHPWIHSDGTVSSHLGIKNWNSNIQLGSLMSEISLALQNISGHKPAVASVQPPFVARPPSLHVLRFSDASDPIRLAGVLGALPVVAEQRAFAESLMTANRKAAERLLELAAAGEAETRNLEKLKAQVRGKEEGWTWAEAASRLGQAAELQKEVQTEGALLEGKLGFIEAREKYHRLTAMKERAEFEAAISSR